MTDQEHEELERWKREFTRMVEVRDALRARVAELEDALERVIPFLEHLQVLRAVLKGKDLP